MSGSVLFLDPAIAAPTGYVLLGGMELVLTHSDGKNKRVVTRVNVYMKQ